MQEKTFRQRFARALGRTQSEAADALGIRQPSLSKWISTKPEVGSIQELMEFALEELGDEQIQGLLRGALEKRASRRAIVPPSASA